MKGYLHSKGIHASEMRVAAALKAVQPPYHETRCQGLRNLNPMPYQAAYFGQKLHMDQNEKMAMYGVTYVVAIDGYSSKIVAYSIMPVKNNLVIYDEVYRNAVVTYGLWDQLRVDHGGEFYLSLYIQEKLSGYRFRQDREPCQQTASTRNHRIERVWPEVNNRVTYPLKAALVHLVDQELIDMDDSTVRYCVSNLTCQVARIGIQRFIDAWNSHTVSEGFQMSWLKVDVR
ncbi:uncharacterized protein LOC121647985 isoform X2 [Melanotaenia boesemani]|uniref:uncharacterized protein LOC121629171 isoform X2 n=1 Tax=Melanotaenia boesemani TaxID=1250792 RepID=UPI001C045101|nr:uncharacterized protein LOC121629171 isoform X2 [Melanotaenia boesemani]XP_041837142.1 uncharacterized protein LOC121637205 isoform X2 [Melanotaenia boesemani]XP_041839811.1 uncharacterized protein LOC121638847 isoform X2 [Melanotaenia boesemani]XP_041853783.1 uncharacterized protein LOC121647985 isoform X2 [Melanotaenia boesemani]